MFMFLNAITKKGNARIYLSVDVNKENLEERKSSSLALELGTLGIKTLNSEHIDASSV